MIRGAMPNVAEGSARPYADRLAEWAAHLPAEK